MSRTGAASAVTRPAEIIGWIEPSAADADWTLKVRTNRAGNVTLSVVDEHGQTVRTIVNGPLFEGESSFSWNGRDASGRPLPPGAYDLKVTSSKVTDKVRFIEGN